MKKMIDKILDNIPLLLFGYFTVAIPIGFFLLIIPFLVIESIFHFDFDSAKSIIFSSIYGTIGFILIIKFREDDTFNKVFIPMFILGFPLTYVFGYIFDNSINENTRTKTSPVSYQARRGYSPNYSIYDSNTSLNYSNSDSPSVPLPEDEKSVPYKNYASTIEIDTPHEEEYNYSPSSEIAHYDKWEYVISDEYGNDYYINKNFGTHINKTSIEGTVIYASFKKVLSGSGREVEVPAYDLSKGMMTTKKEILAYEENIICFRQDKGLEEIKFLTAVGYNADNSIIIGWEKANIDNIRKWMPINDEVYYALYNAAYKNL